MNIEFQKFIRGFTVMGSDHILMETNIGILWLIGPANSKFKVGNTYSATFKHHEFNKYDCYILN